MDKVALSDIWQKYLIICSEGLWLAATNRVGRLCLHRLQELHSHNSELHIICFDDG